MTNDSVGILAAARFLPPRNLALDGIAHAESGAAEPETLRGLGIESVHVFEGESPTEMAVAVSQSAMSEAGLGPLELDAIIDFSVMPQRYVEPAWSMSNELQAELGAKKAFTLGFSGGGSGNIHAALKFARALIRANDDVNTILLAAADRAIPGNRVLSAGEAVTVIGDAATALIVQRNAPSATIVDTISASNGALHDVLNIPGGGMAHPTRLDLYKLTLDEAKYRSRDHMGELRVLTDKMLARNGLAREGIDHFLTANISDDDTEAFSRTMQTNGRLHRDNLGACGHVHSCDLVLNYMSLRGNGAARGDHVLMASHGMGFFLGATLLKL
ncbi:3-oxoacyl-[acyl-carrier-protein] synthase III C-terminal domain-containing protein [Stappia stellulata]|uniref:3-oxoacyl-[acyl-carrier-protein] synthase III C-terminal domain-containing protein n=1 Tax=Stappia stellulata TaxID=71235 RepID=UPI00041790C4|nr:3-oxoacyl-[acyl-carrier-protein] synthase III C-terminal domain-containing protein [Stappia stellulata]